MGNCLSKYPMKFEIESFCYRKSKGSTFQKGPKMGPEEKARSLGFYYINENTV